MVLGSGSDRVRGLGVADGGGERGGPRTRSSQHGAQTEESDGVQCLFALMAITGGW